METKHIRNFCIVAHIDHGKSTLADRMLELTGTIEKRKMREQVLDAMELERERGITIKMTPVRMDHTLHSTPYILNLIDTPGHIDFSYEVSRSLKAVEGVVLLVDATQGIQAQTITTLEMAQSMGLVIIPVVSKIDSPLAETEKVKAEIAETLECPKDSVLGVSGKTGEGVQELFREIIIRIPAPKAYKEKEAPQALVFDFEYSPHQGIIVYVRLFQGVLKKGDQLLFAVTGEKFASLEVGIFTPGPLSKETLEAGEIGYIVTGIKEPSKALVGDTVTRAKEGTTPLSGYERPQPVVWASLYPESQDDFVVLRKALARLKLTDASLVYEEEVSASLGRGFRAGFLGMLHLEIIVERLKREFDVPLILTTPSIIYEVEYKNDTKEKIYSPSLFPDKGTYERVYEPIILMKVITPTAYVSELLQVLHKHEATVQGSQSFGTTRVLYSAEMPLRELMRGFFEELKRISSGYASFSYEHMGLREANVVRLDILVAEEVVPALSQVVAEGKVYEEARRVVERLYTVLPKELFAVKIQGRAHGRILSSKTLSALRKDVTGYLYGGDITRKRKLWEKQKRGKKKLKERGRVTISQDVFLKILKQDS